MTSSSPTTEKEDKEEEWAVVSRHDKKRVMRRNRGGGWKNCKNKKGQQQQHQNTSVLSSSPSITDMTVLRETILKCQEEFQSTYFFTNLCQQLQIFRNSKHNTNFEQIVCYGIGNFSSSSTVHYSAPMWQLACILCVRDWLVVSEQQRQQQQQQQQQKETQNSSSSPSTTTSTTSTTSTTTTTTTTTIPKLVYYDPCSTSLEIDYVNGLKNAEVLTKNDCGKYSAVVNNNNTKNQSLTLFFMPHCPRKLYDNVLWSNYCWDDEMNSHHIVTIGNSLLNPPPLLPSTTEFTKAVSCPCPSIEILAPWLQQIRLDGGGEFSSSKHKFKQDIQKCSGNLLGAFNDTYLTTTTMARCRDNNDDKDSCRWPERPPPADEDDSMSADPELIL